MREGGGEGRQCSAAVVRDGAGEGRIWLLLLLPTDSGDRRLEALPCQQGGPGRPVSANAAPQYDGREEREEGARIGVEGHVVPGDEQL